MYLSTHPPEIVIFAKIFGIPAPQNPEYLTPIALKDPRPAPSYNGGRWERPKPHKHTTSGRGKQPCPPV